MYDYLPWQLMQPALTAALLNEFMRWLTAWLLGVSLMVFVIYLGCLALEFWSERRAKQRPPQSLNDPDKLGWPAVVKRSQSI